MRKSLSTSAYALILFLMMTLCACGPTVRSNAKLPKQLGPIVIIPSAPPPGMSRERAAYITRSFQSELISRGYEVLSDTYVRAECGDVSPNVEQQCAAQGNFFTKYGVQGALVLSLSSLNNTNLYAAYYNSISGSLALRDKSQNELLSVSYTERERGGLLLSGGQVLQGIKASITNVSDEEDHFKILADKFVIVLAASLPPPRDSSTPQPGLIDTLPRAAAAPPKVQSIALSPGKNGNYLLCAKGPSALSAMLVYRGGRTTLRETTLGTYCVVAPLLALSKKGRVEVEIRSPFYGAASKEVLLPVERCDLTKFMRLKEEVGKKVVTINCSPTGATQSNALISDCTVVKRSCAGSSAAVYLAPSIEGPYSSIGQIPLDVIPSKDITVKSRPPMKEVIAVVHREKNAFPSEPIILKSESTTGKANEGGKNR